MRRLPGAGELCGWFVLALAIRLSLLALWGGEALRGDSVNYMRLAQNLGMRGSLSLSDDAAETRPSRSRPPGYPAFIAGIAMVSPGDSLVGAVLRVQAVLDAGLVFLVVVAVKLSSMPIHPRVGIALFAMQPFTFFYSGRIASEGLLIPLMGAILGCAFWWRSNPSLGRLSVLGLLCGAAALVKSDSAFIGIALSLWCWLETAARSRARSLAVLLVANAVVLLPWGLRNAQTFGRFDVLSSPWGVDGVEPTGFWSWVRTWHTHPRERLYGVWPYERGRFGELSFPDAAFDSQEERQRVVGLIASLKEDSDSPARTEVEKAFEVLATERLYRSPLRTLVVLPVKRAFHLWINSRTETLNLPALSDLNGLSATALLKGLVAGTYLALLVLASLGLVRVWSTGFGLPLLLLVVIAYRTAIPAAWAGCEPRYVAPAFPAVLLLAAAGLRDARRHPSTEPQPEALNTSAI